MITGNPDPASLRLVQSDEFLPPVSRWTALGGLFLVGTVGVAITLAAVTKYNVTVKASATVRPVGDLRVVQAATEGTIKRIAVKENQVVEQGDVIAYIDASQLQTERSQLQGNMQQDKLQLAQIAAQIEALDAQTVAESRLMSRMTASAQASLGGNQRDYRERQVTTQTGLQEAQAALDLAQEELTRYQQLANTGAIPQLQIREKEQALKVAKAKVQGARAALDPSDASVTTAAEQIAQEQAKGEASLASLRKEREALIQSRVELQKQLSQSQRELRQIETDLQKNVVRAPTDGTILKLELRNQGQVVRAGESIAQVAPSSVPLVVKARVAAQDVGKVAVGQQAQMRVSAYPYPDYGTLKGTVSTISPDAITPQSSSTAAVTSATSTPGGSIGAGAMATHYEVTIQPDKPYLVRRDLQHPIQPGMEATVDIISREDRVLTFILRKARLLTDL